MFLGEAGRRFLGNKGALAGLAILFLMASSSLAAPVLTSQNPIRSSSTVLSPPAREHFFGTDDLGRDILAGVLYGGRTSLTIGFSVGIASVVIGVPIGALAGYYGGLADEALTKLTEVFTALPRFFVAILLVALLGPSILTIAFSLAILSWPPTSRIARATFLTVKEWEFITASRAIGMSDARIMVKDLLPNAMPLVLVNSGLLISQAILTEAGLSFLGLGDPRAVSYGLMLRNAQPYLHLGAWWLFVFPGIALFVTVLGLNVAADGMSDALDPKQIFARIR